MWERTLTQPFWWQIDTLGCDWLTGSMPLQIVVLIPLGFCANWRMR